MKQMCRFFLFLVFFVFARAGQADIMLMLENPSADQTVSGISVISGWAFSTTAGAKVTVTVSIDGQAFTIPCCVDRADVQAEFEGQPQALNSGFGQTFNYNLLSDGTHKIKLEVTDGQGGSASSPEQSFTVFRPGGFEVLSLLDILFASNLRIDNVDNIDDQEIVMEDVRAVQKEPSTSQTVTIRLAWQTNTQSLGIVKSDNVGSATPAQVAQTTQSGQSEGIQAQAAQAGHIQSNAESDPPIVNLENPAAQNTTGVTGTVSGIGLVSGWALSATSGATISSVRQRVDGVVTNSVPCCSERADVAATFPDQPEALNSGFGAPVNFNLLPTGSRTIGVEVQDSTGASVTVENQVTAVRLGDSEFIDQFDLSDAFLGTSNQTLIIDGVKVRDKATQQVSEGLLAHFAWQPSCQCFVAQAVCGNGSVEPTEECDGTAFAGEDCSSLGYGGGTLNCTDFCEYDTSECAGGPRVYVTNLADNTISIIDTATNIVEDNSIKVGDEPRGLVISPDGALAYVANFRDDTVSVIDTATKTVTATISLQQGKGQKGPQGLAISCDGTRLYTVNGFDDSVSIVDTNTKSVVTTVAVGHRPQRIALTPDGTRAYVTNNNQNSVSVLDLTANPITVIATVPVGKTPDGITASPDGKRVYVANYNFDNDVGEDSVSIIDTATNTTIGEPLAVGFHPVRIAFSQDGTRAYVSSNAAGTISVIDTAAASVIDTAAASVINELLTQDLPEGLVVTNGGKRLYVALFGNNASGSEVEVTSAVTGGTVGLIPVGDGPFEIAIIPPVNFCTP